MKSKTTILQDSNGNGSSTRLIAISIIFMGMICYMSTYIFAFIYPDQAVAIIATSSGAFITVATPTFIFLYNQKKTEVYKELKEQSIVPSN